MEAQLQDYRHEKYTRWKDVLKGYRNATEKRLEWGDFVLEETVIVTADDMNGNDMSDSDGGVGLDFESSKPKKKEELKTDPDAPLPPHKKEGYKRPKLPD
jgi:hypothetical protein